MKRIIAGLLNLVYPNCCVVCGEALVQGEQFICLSCLHNMPKTNYHLLLENPVEKRFWGKVNLERGTSYFHFHKGSDFQQLLYELKYRGNKELGEVVGRYAAVDLLEDTDFASVDVIVPVPLHAGRLKERGYNQSEWIARGLAAVMHKPIDTTHLIRVHPSSTQTRKTVYERYLNMEGIFQLNDMTIFENKHVLLVDDVLTTGSTLEACIQAIQHCAGVRISIFTLAVA